MAFRITLILTLLVFMTGLYLFMNRDLEARRENFTVFAASSFAYVLKAEKAMIEDRLGVNLVVVEAASSTLARQISEGAPADVFITADPAWLAFLEAGQKIVPPSGPFAANSLVFVIKASVLDRFCRVLFLAPPNAPDLLTACPFEGKVATGDPSFVPLGAYAEKALARHNLALDLIPAANASDSLRLLQTGAAPAAILYKNQLAFLGKGWQAYSFPAEPGAPIGYFSAPLKQSNSSATQNFLDFLKSGAFKTILEERGFEVNESDLK